MLCILTVGYTPLAGNPLYLYTVMYRSFPGEWDRPVIQRVAIGASMERSLLSWSP